jgi:hypothetical protein
MPEDRIVKVFENTPEGKGYAGKAGKRYLHDVENCLKKMGVKRLEKNS